MRCWSDFIGRKSKGGYLFDRNLSSIFFSKTEKTAPVCIINGMKLFTITPKKA